MAGNRSRRRFLLGVGTASSLAVAGCLGDDDEMGDDEMEVSTALSSHPLGQDLETWPTLGSDPFDASATLILLDDPSCPRCAVFHSATLPVLEEEYVQSGDLTIVNRPYPVVYDWGGPAAHALEATLDRDGGEEAFWGLLAHYFDEQPDFDADNVLDRTETWLDSNTDIDGSGVVSDVHEDAFADRLDATIGAGEEAGAGGVTPASFLFEDGELQTTLNGSVSPVTIETVLGL